MTAIPDPPDPAAWLTVGEAAHLLGLSAQRVRVLADQGTLEMSRSPLGRLISRASAEALAKVRAGA